MSDNDNSGGFVVGLGPGGRTSRQENIQTELWLPAAQAALRAGADLLAGILVLTALMILGRWVMWFGGILLLFSEGYQTMAYRFTMRFVGWVGQALRVALAVLQWGWTFFGGLVVLILIVPVTWTMEGRLLIQTATLAPVWPVVFWRAPWVDMAFGPFARLLAFMAVTAPLLTIPHLRNRMRWALMEITPFSAVDPTKPGVGINPDGWGKTPSEAQKRGAGAIVERVDYDPHETVIAEGVAISNASGSHVNRVDMGWVTHEQWERVAYLLLVRGESFAEQVLGRGLVFPTHGPEDVVYGGKLGFRFFRQQMMQAGMVEHRGSHPNEGYQLTQAGMNFLGRFLSEGDLALLEWRGGGWR